MSDKLDSVTGELDKILCNNDRLSTWDLAIATRNYCESEVMHVLLEYMPDPHAQFLDTLLTDFGFTGDAPNFIRRCKELVNDMYAFTNIDI